MKIYINDLVKGHSDVKVKCLTFGLYTQMSDSGPLGPLVWDLYFICKLFKCYHPLKADNKIFKKCFVQSKYYIENSLSRGQTV